MADPKLKTERKKELELLQNLRNIFVAAKQELNNDLTKMAIKSLPIMQAHSRHCEEPNLSQSSQSEVEAENSEGDTTMQQLEPLDLDI